MKYVACLLLLFTLMSCLSSCSSRHEIENPHCRKDRKKQIVDANQLSPAAQELLAEGRRSLQRHEALLSKVQDHNASNPQGIEQIAVPTGLAVSGEAPIEPLETLIGRIPPGATKSIDLVVAGHPRNYALLCSHLVIGEGALKFSGQDLEMEIGDQPVVRILGGDDVAECRLQIRDGRRRFGVSYRFTTTGELSAWLMIKREDVVRKTGPWQGNYPLELSTRTEDGYGYIRLSIHKTTGFDGVATNWSTVGGL